MQKVDKKNELGAAPKFMRTKKACKIVASSSDPLDVFFAAQAAGSEPRSTPVSDKDAKRIIAYSNSLVAGGEDAFYMTKEQAADKLARKEPSPARTKKLRFEFSRDREEIC